LARPGHVFPLRARQGGVLVRAGQTEASVDLARMAGLNPAGVICEIMRDDGEMARIPDLIPFCREHGLTILTVAELIRYRLRNERYIVRVGESRIQTKYGEFRMIAYESEVNGGESHIALVKATCVRIARPCMAGRRSARCWTNWGAACRGRSVPCGLRAAMPCWCECIRAARQAMCLRRTATAGRFLTSRCA